MRKLDIKIRWCDVVEYGVLNIIMMTRRKTESEIDIVIKKYLTHEELAYIARKL